MILYHKMNSRQYLLVLAATIITGTPIGYAILMKRKMCVEYQIRNSRWNETILRVFYGKSEGECLLQCVSHPECVAYNTGHANGTCELVSLPLGNCVETKETEGFKFVSLSDCNGKVPWNVGRRNWTSDAPCLTWHLHYSYNFRGGGCPDGTLKDPRSWSCASLLPQRGLYLPGWCAAQHSYRVVTEQHQRALCPGAGYILKVAPGCPTTWLSYTVGDPLPSGAVRVSTWKDGTPLYLVMVKHGFNWYMGYLLSSVQRTFIITARMVSPRDVSILVFT